MKTLKIIALILIVLILLFLLLGLIKPTVNYGHEITVKKPINEAWAVLQDETKLNQWLKGFKSIDLISGSNGAVGSKYKVIVNPGEGQPDFEMIETIESIKENEYINLSFDSDMMAFSQLTSLSESDGQTTIRTESEVQGKGIMMRSMFAVMETFGGSFYKQEVENIENLKKVIESNSTVY